MTNRIGVAALGLFLIAARANAQGVEYRAGGMEYKSQADTGGVARAQTALAADPRNITLFIALGTQQSNVRHYHEAIETFTRGLAIEPNNALLLRWRGHRYLSVREFDKALADLTRGSQLDSTIYGIWYHLGIVRFARGEFGMAADAFTKSQRIAPDANELAGSTDWLWMSLSRAGRKAEAAAMLARKPDSLPSTAAYTQRLKLYRGLSKPDDVITAADTADIQLSTLSYGIGNWYLVNGQSPKAREWFERSIKAGGWPAFGFIISEIDLKRAR